jgi:hypothetical protein
MQNTFTHYIAVRRRLFLSEFFYHTEASMGMAFSKKAEELDVLYSQMHNFNYERTAFTIQVFLYSLLNRSENFLLPQNKTK